MAHIDALVDKVADPALRAALREQVDALLQKRSFGLVFQEHRPETVELPQHRVRRGCKVRVWDGPDQVLYRVDKINGDEASITSLTEPPVQRSLPRSDLVVVREFGDPVYPGLVSTGRVHRGGDKPAHVVINAENFHALETLLYTHEGKVDAIYIDPPYNTRDKDWKYNNDYVDSDDVYRHSKWLAMMQRRLDLAKQLLNPQNSVLIVTIDQNEVHRLALLLEKMFAGHNIQMVTTLINPQGIASGAGEFSRVEEYLFFVYVGDAKATPWSRSMVDNDKEASDVSEDRSVRWADFARYGGNASRRNSPGAFFPIYVEVESETIHSVGDALEWGADPQGVDVPRGTRAVWPPQRPDGEDGRWRVVAESCRELVRLGYLRVGPYIKRSNRHSIAYLQGGAIAKITTGEIVVTGRDSKGAVLVEYAANTKAATPKTVWTLPSHDASRHGSNLLRSFVPGRAFPYPKSLYAVEDALRFFVKHKPEAVVLDFFAGSGTTTHAVMRLNRQDGGRRQSICVTNNEVSDTESRQLRQQGLTPGDPEWEKLGICDYISKPRIEAAITGQTVNGQAVVGEYRFTDNFPMEEGFLENAEFFNLTYENPDLVSLGRAFQAIAPLLWLKAGGRGAILDAVVEPWALTPDAHYAVLFDTDHWREFVDEVGKRDDLAHLFIVTDSEAAFQQVAGEVPRSLVCTQLYEDYLHNFQINTRGRR